MAFNDEIMVASGAEYDPEHPSTEKVGLENIPQGGGGEGHSYNLVQNSKKDETILKEDGRDKTSLPLVATFVGTRAEWNALTENQKSRYRRMDFTDDNGLGNAYNIPHGNSNVGNDLDDTKSSTVTFTSSDTTDANANSWTSVTKLDSGETHTSIFAKISQMFKNVRYLYKELTTVKSSLNNLPKKIEVVGKGTSTSISANGYEDIVIDATLSGYTPIGIVGYKINGNPNVATIYIDLSGTDVKVRVRNLTSSTQSITSVTVRVLYK